MSPIKKKWRQSEKGVKLNKNCETATTQWIEVRLKVLQSFASFWIHCARSQNLLFGKPPPWVDDPKRYRVCPATMCRSGEHLSYSANTIYEKKEICSCMVKLPPLTPPCSCMVFFLNLVLTWVKVESKVLCCNLDENEKNLAKIETESAKFSSRHALSKTHSSPNTFLEHSAPTQPHNFSGKQCDQDCQNTRFVHPRCTKKKGDATSPLLLSRNLILQCAIATYSTPFWSSWKGDQDRYRRSLSGGYYHP